MNPNYSQLTNLIAEISELKAEWVLGGGFLLLILADLIFHFQKNKNASSYLTIISAIILLIALFFNIDDLQNPVNKRLMYDMLVSTSPSALIKIMIITCAGFTLAFTSIGKYKVPNEFFSLLMASTFGLSITIMSSNWLSLLLGLEIVSLSFYTMVGFKFTKQSAEAALKYILTGALATALMLYGISFLYGFTGELNFTNPAYPYLLAEINSHLAIFALLLATCALLFKLSVVPLHIWAPDVYQATPLPILSFIITATKITAISVLLFYWNRYSNVSFYINQNLNVNWSAIIAVVAILSLIVGNFSAVSQQNLKRFVAYTSIAQIGFVLLALLPNNRFGAEATLFYIGTYALSTFALLWLIHCFNAETFTELAINARKNIVLALLLCVTLISLAGLPPTFGFTTKFMVFTALFEAYSSLSSVDPILANIYLSAFLVALATSLISFYYYLKIPYLIFIKKIESDIENQAYKMNETSMNEVIFASILVLPLIIAFFINFPNLIR